MNSPRVYGLDLNGGDIGAAATVRIWYLEFLERESIHDDPYVRILPMNAWEAATAVLQLMEHSVEDGMGFESGLLAQAFDEMNECLQQPKPPVGDGWMANVLMDAALSGPALTSEGDGPPGTR